MKKINALMLLAVAILISNCRTESVDFSDNNLSPIINSKSDSTGMYKMKDVPLFKSYLKKNLPNIYSKSDDSELSDDNQLIDVINKNDKISYSILIKKENNVHQIWVYTIGQKESFFIAEYTSSVPAQYFELDKFTGTVEYKALDGEILGTENFENGRPIKNGSAKAVCGVVTTPVSCVDGLHFGNQPCAWAGTSGAAYYDTEIIRCKNNYQNTIYNDGGGYGSEGGATNPAYHLPAPQALNYMLTQIGMPSLNSQQFAYVQNNIPIAERLRTFFFTDQTVNGSNFLYWGIDFLKQNPSINWVQFEKLIHNKNNYENFASTSIDEDNNQSGNYDETLYSDFDFENQQTQWPTINPVIPASNFVGWGASGIRRNCMDYAKAQIAKSGYKVSNYYDVDSQGNKQTFQIYTEQGGVNLNDLYKGVSYLKYALSNGIPVIVGIDDKTGHPGNLDSSTDHFVVIVGMGTDSKGRYFRFYDNAAGDQTQGTHSENKLYIKYPDRIFTGQTQCVGYRAGTEYDYIITMIRKSK